jgi:hypothetical protein
LYLSHAVSKALAEKIFIEYTGGITAHDFLGRYQAATQGEVLAFQNSLCHHRFPMSAIPNLFLDLDLECHWRHCQWNKLIVRYLRERFSSKWARWEPEELEVVEPEWEAIEALFWHLIRIAVNAHLGLA